MERRIYGGMIGLLLLALAGFVWFAWSRETHGVLLQGRFRYGLFVSVMLASVPVATLIMIPLRLILGASRGRAIWIKHPARTVTRESAEAAEAVLQRAGQRLAELGFVVQEGEAGGTEKRLIFSKPKAEKVERFVDHALVGEVAVSRESGRTRAVGTIIFQDTIVVDSGEFERLDTLAGYLVGATDELSVPALPFTMVCGVMIAVVNAALWPVASVRGWLIAEQYSIALAAVAMIVLGGYTIVTHRQESHGAILGGLGLIAALTPLLAG